LRDGNKGIAIAVEDEEWWCGPGHVIDRTGRPGEVMMIGDGEAEELGEITAAGPLVVETVEISRRVKQTDGVDATGGLCFREHGREMRAGRGAGEVDVVRIEVVRGSVNFKANAEHRGSRRAGQDTLPCR